MGIAIGNLGKGHSSRLSKSIIAQAGSSPDDKISINGEHKCIAL